MTTTAKQLEELTREINSLNKTKEDLTAKLLKDFLYEFTWKSEELYKTSHKLEELNMIIAAIQEDRLTVEKAIEYLTKQVMNWTPNRSTCQLTNVKALWELEAIKEMIQLLNWTK
jgi:chromosome segregation ATPase